jgi:hypothetical protein
MPMSDDSAPCAASVLLAVLVLMIPAAVVAGAVTAQEPFRGGVVFLTIDVQVTASKEASLQELTAGDFEVVVSGRRRPVTSAARLHLDEGSILPNQPRPGRGANTECIFDFHRRTDRPTAHYRLAIQPAGTDRSAREVRVTVADSTFATEWLVWRLPVR